MSEEKVTIYNDTFLLDQTRAGIPPHMARQVRESWCQMVGRKIDEAFFIGAPRLRCVTEENKKDFGVIAFEAKADKS